MVCNMEVSVVVTPGDCHGPTLLAAWDVGFMCKSCQDWQVSGRETIRPKPSSDTSHLFQAVILVTTFSISTIMSKKTTRIRWTDAQEQSIKEEVKKRPILLDPSTSNNMNMRMAAWKEVTDHINLTFNMDYTRIQVRKKYGDLKGSREGQSDVGHREGYQGGWEDGGGHLGCFQEVRQGDR